MEALAPCQLEFKDGEVKGTNVDLAIIDRRNKVCLCLELKWFIEPAEIREIDERTKELAIGIGQAKIINALHAGRNERLMKDVLDIDADFAFLTAVASRNWIGHDDAQDPEVPIIKVWHLLSKMKECSSLLEILSWLKSREYLPKEGADYSIEPWEISCGTWQATWYGIKPLASGQEHDFR